MLAALRKNLAIFVQCNILASCKAVEPSTIETIRHPASDRTVEEVEMVKTFDDMNKLGKDNVDATLKSFGTFSQTSQAIAAELVDYSKRSFEGGTKTLEQLLGAKSFDKALEIQTGYAKSAFEDFMAEATKIGEMCADLAKEASKPYEAFLAKAPAR